MYMYTYTHMQKFWHQRYEIEHVFWKDLSFQTLLLNFFHRNSLHFCVSDFVSSWIYEFGCNPYKFISIPSLWLISGRYANLHWPLWSFDISRDIWHVPLQTKITIFWSTYSDVRWCHRVANSLFLVNPVETVLPRPQSMTHGSWLKLDIVIGVIPVCRMCWNVFKSLHDLLECQARTYDFFHSPSKIWSVTMTNDRTRNKHRNHRNGCVQSKGISAVWSFCSLKNALWFLDVFGCWLDSTPWLHPCHGSLPRFISISGDGPFLRPLTSAQQLPSVCTQVSISENAWQVSTNTLKRTVSRLSTHWRIYTGVIVRQETPTNIDSTRFT